MKRKNILLILSVAILETTLCAQSFASARVRNPHFNDETKQFHNSSIFPADVLENLQTQEKSIVAWELESEDKNKKIEHILNLITNYGVDINELDKCGRTAIHYLCWFGSIDNLKKAIWENGVKQKLKTNKKLDRKDVGMPDSGASYVYPPSSDRFGMTPLMYACSNYDKDIGWMAQFLLRTLNDNIYAKDKNERTCFHYACIHGNLEMLEALVSYKKQHFLNISLDTKDKDGSTPLHYACAKGHANVVEYLVKIPEVDVNAQDKYGSTPLHYACAKGHSNVVEVLVKIPEVDVNAQDKYGSTPLHYACAKGHANVVKYLVKIPKVDVNTEGKYGSTPLHYACAKGHSNVVEVLVEIEKVDVNIIDADGMTPLHHACSNGHADVVKFLVGKVDVNIRDADGMTPLHYACQNGYNSIAKILVEQGNAKIYLGEYSEGDPSILDFLKQYAKYQASIEKNKN